MLNLAARSSGSILYYRGIICQYDIDQRIFESQNDVFTDVTITSKSEIKVV